MYWCVALLVLLTTNASQAKAEPPDERALRLVNHYRQLAGLTPVKLDQQLSAGCMEHANYMVQNRGTDATLGQCERIVVRHEARSEYGSVAVSARKCARRLKALNLDHCQIVEATLIRAEAIGRTEPHAEVAMKDQAERFPTVVTSHAFNMRQRSSVGAAFEVPVSPITQNYRQDLRRVPNDPSVCWRIAECKGAASAAPWIRRLFR